MPRKKINYADNYYKPFPNRLRRLMRGDAGKINRTVSQQELADYLGLKARQSVSAYCDGSGQPSWENIAKIAMYLRTGYSVFPMLKVLSETFKLQLLHLAFQGKQLRI